MTRVPRIISVVLACALLAAGCASFGPTTEPQFGSAIASAIGTDDGAVVIYGTGQWFADSRGFSDLRSRPRPTHPGRAGIVAICERAIVFQQWEHNLERFEVVKRIALAEVTEVRLDTYGLNRMAVVRKRDLAFESFQFVKVGSQQVDAALTEQAVALLEGLVQLPGPP